MTGHRWVARAVDLQRHFGARRGGNLAAAISMRAFLALFPLLVLAIAFVGFFVGNADQFADTVIKELGLSGDAATTITDSVQTAQKSKVASSIIGIVGLVWTGTGLAASITDAWNQMWEIPGGTLRGRLVGLGWLTGGGALLVAGLAAGALVDEPGALPALGLIGGIAVDIVLFLWTAWILPSRRIPLRAMVPAAIAGGIGFETLKVIGTVVVPRLVTRSSTLYGTIGVVFALLVWMLVLGYLVVYVALIERIGWDRAQGARRATSHEPSGSSA